MKLTEVSKIWVVLAFVVLVIGCALSVNPVIPESDATFDSRLLGFWKEESGSDRASISRMEGNTYAIEYASEGKTAQCKARLGLISGRLVLDVWPSPPDGDLPELYAGLLIAGHLVVAIDISADEVRIAALDPEPLLAALNAGEVKLNYIQSRDQLALNGTTEELRNALGAYLAKPGALTESSIWRRSKGPESAKGPVNVPCFEASSWREADRLFHCDPHWVGGDGASSVDLGNGRILWLFGDSWIDPSGRGTRRGARMVSNTVAIQRGADPSTATISFYWGRAADGSPAAFVPDRDGEALWLGNGIRVGDRLVLFFSRVLRGTGTGLGFESVGWTALLVENPDAEPSAWRMRTLETPVNPFGVLVGYGAVLQIGEHVYALGSEDPVKSHPIYAVRWPAEDVRRGALLEPQWWAGERLGWILNSSSARRWPLFENGQSDLTIHLDRATGRYLEVQTQGFGPADVVARAAPALTGPWSATRLLYRPPEYYRPNVMIYSAKAHPQLAGADLVLTYATNTFQFAEQLTDSAIYYPRFVRLMRCSAAGEPLRSRPSTVPAQ